MSFLSLFFRWVVLLIVVSTIGFFGARELLLFAASQQVAQDARLVSQTSRWKEQVNGCSGGLVTETPYDGFQLRFTSPTTYNMEVHCLSAAPAVWQNKQLPYGVTKTTGSAGFYYDFVNKTLSGELTLELWGQKRLVYVDGEKTGHNWGQSLLRAQLPASVCASHGLVCCDSTLQIGQDEPLSAGVTDCPGQCFQSCQQRPVLLSFQADPFMEYETREVPVYGDNTLVLMMYVFDGQESPVKRVVIDFGDGTQQEFTTPTGQAQKTYACAQKPCRYTATIFAEDERGIVSAQTRISTMTVIIGAPLPEGAL